MHGVAKSLTQLSNFQFHLQIIFKTILGLMIIIECRDSVKFSQMGKILKAF